MTTTLDERPQPSEQSGGPDRTRSRARMWLVVLSALWLGLGSWLLLTESPPRIGFGVTPALAHTGLLFFVAITLWAVVIGSPRSTLIRVGLVVIAFTVVTEIAQAWVTNERSGSLLDVGSNLIGVVLAAVFAVGATLLLPHAAAAQRTVAAMSTFALIGLIVSMVAATPAASNWRACRGTSVSTTSITPLVDLDEPTANGITEIDHDARRLGCEIVRTDQFTAVVEFRSDTVSQEGPSRILTSSVGPAENQVNFHIGQAGTNLSIRIRSGPEQTREWFLVDNVISADVDHRVAIRVSDGELDVWLDGVLLETLELEHTDLDGWNASYPLIIGDEATGERPFLGTVTLVELYATALPDSALR